MAQQKNGVCNHQFEVTTYFTSTCCDYCKQEFQGLVKQGIKCQKCLCNYHENCIELYETSGGNKSNCVHKLTEKIHLSSTKCDTCKGKIGNLKKCYKCESCHSCYHKTCLKSGMCEHNLIETTFNGSKNCNHCNQECENNTEGLKCTICDNHYHKKCLPQEEPVVSENETKKPSLERVSKSVKNGNFFWDGLVPWSSSEIEDVKTSFWRLGNKAIHVYSKLRPKESEKLFDIELKSIIKASSFEVRKDSHKYAFSLKTENTTYFCGLMDDEYISFRNKMKNFYNLFRIAYLPYSKEIECDINPIMGKKDFNEEYFMEIDNLLGGGQFGQVYKGKSKITNKPVAVKLIDKTGFLNLPNTDITLGSFQSETLILCNFKHQGVVEFYDLFETNNTIYVVTELMAIDMLQYIIESKNRRLPERISKFLIYQILVALDFLHKNNIAHCDLKPENVLLAEISGFPQVKICDFGYAKIVGENSFRKSVVGTLAYSPPELVQTRVFNKSMDLWSMGVIVYVSLSGTFPFNEGDLKTKVIYENLKHLDYLFSDTIWKSISKEAIDLMFNELLQTDLDRRACARNAMDHAWFTNDYQLYGDLQKLEENVNEKWLTPIALDAIWRN